MKLPSLNIPALVARYAAFIIRWRIPVVIASLLAIVGMAGFAGRVGFDTNYRIWFEADDPYLASYDRFIREFGNDDTFIVAFEDEQGIVSAPAIETVQRLTAELWRVKGVIRVDSLSNFQATRAVPDGIEVEDLFPEDRELDAATLQRATDYIDREPLIVGSLISTNRQVAILRGKFAPQAMTPELPAQVYAQLTKILDSETARSGYQFHIAGGPITDEAFNQVAQADMGKLLPILLLVMLLILGLAFFSFWGLLLPVFTGLATIAVTMGISGLLGFKLNQVTATSPQLMLGLATATVMHILATFFEAKREQRRSRESAQHALEDNMVPILLTNLATTLGFASFTVGNVEPITLLGYVAGIGSMVLTLLSLTLVPALLSFYPRNAPRWSPLQRVNFPGLFKRLGAWSVRAHRKVIMGWVAVTVAFCLFIPSLVVDSNPVLYFKETYWFRQSIDFVEQRGSGGAVYEIVVRGNGGENSIKTLDYMRDLDRLTEYLKTEAPGEFRNVYSLSTILRNLNRSMHGDDPAYHVLPDSDSAIAQYLLLYGLSVPQGQDINDRMNVSSSASRVTIVRPLVSTRISRQNIDTISRWAEAHLTHAKIEFTGRDVLYTNMGNNITDSLITSLGFDVLVIIPLLLLMFRAWTAGIVSVFVNVGPLLIVMGLMGAFGILLDVGTLMVAALGLGIAVDDTVHLLAHYFRYRRAGATAERAAIDTMSHIGTPAALTTLTLTCGFLVFLGAQFEPNYYFGILISVVVTLALLADLTLTPALLYWLDRRRDPKPAAESPLVEQPTT